MPMIFQTFKNMGSNEYRELNPEPRADESNRKITGPFSIILQPFRWLHMLSSELNPTFILGVVVVYGLCQGFARSFFGVVSDYYWKDDRKAQPSQVQLYVGLYNIPWVLKPVWGLLTDAFPVRGYRRRPYLLLAGVLGVVSSLMVAFGGKLVIPVAVGCLVGIMAGVAIAEVTIDACIARNSILIRSLAPDMQSLCWFCSAIGALLGSSASGFLVHSLGAQESLGLLAIPLASVIVIGLVIHEMRTTILHCEREKSAERLKRAMKGVYTTILFPQVWKPLLYIYLSVALSISTHEGEFYWYTDPKAGPAFSQEFVGIINAFGATASIFGLLLYHKILKDYPFRNLLFLGQVLFGLSSLLDLIFILRWNLFLGIPDSFFVIMDECITRIISRIRWMPMVVLCTRLCPLGIEGTFFALLMCVENLGSLSSRWAGGLALHLLHVTRTDYTNLWLAVLTRGILGFATLSLIFLVPNADHTHLLIPPDLLANVNAGDESLENPSLV